MTGLGRRLVATMAVTLAVVSCGGDDSTTQAIRTSTTASSALAFERGEQYLRAFSQGGEAFAEAIDLSAPDSVAQRYAEHTQAVNESQMAAGEDLDLPDLSVDGEVITLTFATDSAEPVPTRWSDFTVDDEGLLVDFTIDGQAIDDRLVAPGEPQSSGDVVAQVSSAFRLVTSDNIVAVVELENGADADFTLLGATYEPPEGELRTTGPAGDGLVVPPGAANRVVLVFEPSELGGVLTLGGETGSPVTIELPLMT